MDPSFCFKKAREPEASASDNAIVYMGLEGNATGQLIIQETEEAQAYRTFCKALGVLPVVAGDDDMGNLMKSLLCGITHALSPYLLFSQ